MGLFGGGNSTTQNLTTENTTDQRQTVQTGNAVNSGGGKIVINQTPQGAFGVVRQMAASNAQIASNALDSASASTQLALQTLHQASTPTGQALGSQLITLGVPALAMILLFKR